MQSKAATVPAYLRSLPADRRAEIEKVRAVINENLDRDGYEERMSYGMICWVVPHRVFPAGYHCNPEQPLPFAGLAAQKNYCSVYVPLVVPADVPRQNPHNELHRWFVDAWKKSGKKLDMGKCCIRFHRAEDLALPVLGELIRRVPAPAFLASYIAARDAQAKRGPKPRAEIRAEAAARKAAKGARATGAASRAATRVAKKAPSERAGQPAQATPRVYSMPFARIYPLYVQKAERKGRTKAEVDQILCWLTGHDARGLKKVLAAETDLQTFLTEAPRFHPNASRIQGVVCGIRVEEIVDPTMRRMRCMDKLIDELAKGKAMAQILRT